MIGFLNRDHFQIMRTAARTYRFTIKDRVDLPLRFTGKPVYRNSRTQQFPDQCQRSFLIAVSKETIETDLPKSLWENMQEKPPAELIPAQRQLLDLSISVILV